jgi:hypothetical protein
LEAARPSANDCSRSEFAVFGGLGSIVYLFVFNRRTRQSLHDLIVGTFVVRAQPLIASIRLSTPRLHLIVVGSWLAFALIGPGVAAWVTDQSSVAESLKPLTEIQTAIDAQVGVRRVAVMMGETTISAVHTGTSTMSYLQVEAQLHELPDDVDAVLAEIAGVVLKLHPDLLGADILIVQVRHGFDFGVAGWSEAHREALDLATWREKVRSRPPRPNMT